MTQDELIQNIGQYFSTAKSDEEKIQTLNALRASLHRHSPFQKEPVDCVIWVKTDKIVNNDYNPNVMAPVEKRLLKHSLQTDGFTQPIVVSEEDGKYRVVDGFHRHMLGKSVTGVGARLNGYLPVTCVNASSSGEAERIAATIRHNRARGKHKISSMSDIVRDLHRLGWDNTRISRELGMDEDEVLRLKQISGLAELFAGEAYSQAWTVE